MRKIGVVTAEGYFCGESCLLIYRFNFKAGVVPPVYWTRNRRPLEWGEASKTRSFCALCGRKLQPLRHCPPLDNEEDFDCGYEAQ